MKHILTISWIAIRELLYEKVFYLLVLFAIAALALSFLLGQMTYGEQTKLTLDFMLAGTHLSMVLFAIFVGISLFQREMQLGSIAMVLSKPISRSSFLLGKFTGQAVIQFAVVALMTGITVVSCPGLSGDAYLAITQACWLIGLEVTVIAAVSYVFAVNFGPLVAAMGSIALFLLGHFVPTVSKNQTLSESAALMVIKAFVPKLEMFNMKALASYGFALPISEIGLVTVYGILMTSVFLAIASLTFSRRDILT